MLKYLNDVEKNPKMFVTFIKFSIFIGSLFLMAWGFYSKVMNDFDNRFFSKASGAEIEVRVDRVENKIDRRLEIIEGDIKQILKSVK